MNRKAVQNVHGTAQPQRAVQTQGKVAHSVTLFFANNATDQEHYVLLTYFFAFYSRLYNWRLARAILPYSVLVYGCQQRQPFAQGPEWQPYAVRHVGPYAKCWQNRLQTHHPNSRLINTCAMQSAVPQACAGTGCLNRALMLLAWSE